VTAPFADAADSIADFAVGSDRLRLAANVFGDLAAGALQDGAFLSGTAALTAEQRLIHDSLTGALWFRTPMAVARPRRCVSPR
jgi:Ca2+-binding RTX toxin-like protein